MPGPDFLRRILLWYEQGADYVVVRSLVANRDNIWAQFIYASGTAQMKDQPEPLWSEGFSCRRLAVEAVGYIPGDFPIPFCRDNRLSKTLAQAGFKNALT